ncbi:MAG: FGGY family carbohydrate kinase [Chloroflexota bacterium]|nr:FGGY family carbohydrate kinase [Chloroflexota bacterium]
MSSKTKRFLMALDFGTGAGRCFIIEVGGRENSSAYSEWAFDAPPDAQPGGFSFDPEVFWKTLGQAAKSAMKRGGVDPAQIVAVSSTSLREGFVLLDGSGQEIFAVPNRDARAWAESMEISQRLGQAMNDVSGHWPNPIMAPSRFLWLQRHKPEIVDQARTLLMINDWILYRLCGERACEPTNAAETCLYDIAEHRWDENLLRDCQIPVDIFPPIMYGGQVLGTVTAAAAKVTGLVPGTPVVVGGADTQCGVLGSGAVEPGAVVVVAGTSTPNQMVLDSPVIDERGRTWSGPHIPAGRWVLESNAGSTGSVLRWFRDSFCQEEIAVARDTGENVYHLMEQLAQQSPIGSVGMTALVGSGVMNARHILTTALSGFVMGNARGMLAETDSKRHFIRALQESHAFAVRGNCEQLQGISGQMIERLMVCGGCSVSDFWMQMVADVMGMAVSRPVISEASAVGAAICAGVGAGEYADLTQGMDALVTLRDHFEPNAESHAAYEGAYRRWLELRGYVSSNM